MDKLTGQVMVHVPDTAERQIKALASIKGQKASEYVRDLIMSHLDEQERQFHLMADVFGSIENDE